MGDTIRQHVDQHFLLERCDLFGVSFDSSGAIAAHRMVIANDVHLVGRDVAECGLIGAIRLGQAAELASPVREFQSSGTGPARADVDWIAFHTDCFAT